MDQRSEGPAPERETDYAGLLLFGPIFSLVVGPIIAGFVAFPAFVLGPLLYVFGFIPAGLAGVVFSIVFVLLSKAIRHLRTSIALALLFAAVLGSTVGYAVMAIVLGVRPIDWWQPTDQGRLGILAGGLTGICMVYWWYKKERLRTS